MTVGRSQAAQRMLEGLRRAGLKLTPQRVAIVEAFADDLSHPTAQEIFERLRSAMPTMSFATVYSTLDTLAAADLCSVRALAPGAARFDPHVAPHHHAVCDRCGAMIDLPDEALAPRRRHAPAGFKLRAVELIYRGTCAACDDAARSGHGHEPSPSASPSASPSPGPSHSPSPRAAAQPRRAGGNS